MNRELTADAIGVHERASATPVRRDRARAVRGRAERAPLPEQSGLRSQQAIFCAAVMTPEDEPELLDDAAAARLVTPSGTLSALERLGIYRTAYHARLIECLSDDYPVLKHALGDAAFDALCRGYVAKHPSTGPSLNDFGRHMADFCRTSLTGSAGFAGDLAKLEWAVVLAIHAPTAAVLGTEELATVPLERWPEVRLVANPSLRILHFAYPVNAYFQAYRSGEAPSMPSEAVSSVAVYRTGRSIWRLPLTEAMVVLFESLASGTALGPSLALLEPLLLNDPEAAPRVMGWFRQGVSSGLFSGIVAT
jgi:hypothetical protein